MTPIGATVGCIYIGLFFLSFFFLCSSSLSSILFVPQIPLQDPI